MGQASAPVRQEGDLCRIKIEFNSKMYSTESVADVEVRKEANPQGPWIKKALVLALVSYVVTRKPDQAAMITAAFLLVMFFLR